MQLSECKQRANVCMVGWSRGIEQAFSVPCRIVHQCALHVPDRGTLCYLYPVTGYRQHRIAKCVLTHADSFAGVF
jgi:hypothetical protein